MPRPPQFDNGTPHCLFHCSRCDAHFRSESAFVAHHRVITGANRLGAKTRDVYCRAKLPSRLSQIEGQCSLTKGEDTIPARIWSERPRGGVVGTT
jgi:hypothetical protein